MDEDLKQLLEEMRQENTAAHAETRRYAETAAGDSRRHIDAVTAETRRHFDVIAEGLRHEIKIVADGVAANTEQIGRLETKVDQIVSALDARVTRLEAASFRSQR